MSNTTWSEDGGGRKRIRKLKERITEKGSVGVEETCGGDEWRGEVKRNRNT